MFVYTRFHIGIDLMVVTGYPTTPASIHTPEHMDIERRALDGVIVFWQPLHAKEARALELSSAELSPA